MKSIDVPTDQLEFHRDDLQEKRFEIKAIARNSIEAKFEGEYLTGVELVRELDREGWVCKEMGRVHINRKTQ